MNNKFDIKFERLSVLYSTVYKTASYKAHLYTTFYNTDDCYHDPQGYVKVCSIGVGLTMQKAKESALHQFKKGLIIEYYIYKFTFNINQLRSENINNVIIPKDELALFSNLIDEDWSIKLETASQGFSSY